jgi:glycolate oxidase FAD binding subunit
MTLLKALSETDVIEAVMAARARATTIEIVGAGTRRDFGRPVEATDMLDVSAISGIVTYEPDELVITAKAATTIAEIADAIGRTSQRLGFDPADWGPLFAAPAHAATIGGVVSASACGSARVRYGEARDHLLGYRAVNGLGESYKAGGRVVKNVTGFDLPKLMCGAMGTLGVLTEVTLRLVPATRLSMTLLACNVAPDAGFDLLRCAWTSAFGPTGLAYIPGSMSASFPEIGGIGAGAALIRIEGARAALDEKRTGVGALMPSIALENVEDEDIFRAIGDGRAFVHSKADIWRVVVPPLAASLCAEEIGSATWLADWAGGLLWIGVQPDDDEAATHIRFAALAHGGHATLMRGGASLRRRVPVFQPLNPALAALTKSVKAAFDPLGIFNPGRMHEGI